MELILKRRWFTPQSTVGELTVDGEWECYTLEDQVREGLKVPGATAIPAGRYEVAITFSNRFQKYLPLLLEVPGFEGIRIHPGNSPADTEGCILVGQTRAPDWIGGSRLAFAHLFLAMRQAAKREKIFMEVQNAPQTEEG